MHFSEIALLAASEISFLIILLLAISALFRDYSEQRKLFAVVYFYASLFYSIFLISKIFSITSSFIQMYKLAPIIVLLGFVLILVLFILNIPYLALCYFFLSAALIVIYLFFGLSPALIYIFHISALITMAVYAYLYVRTKNNRVLLLLVALFLYALAGFSKIIVWKSMFYIAANFSMYYAIDSRWRKK
ncbi:MAG: hypothetical protein DRO04_00430 [Candidatus Iainarchaeum archaeon]|uniref:Uncharacterized protein n=1 Tax=Candidatus Iainarchaeum sp. TaxID=3101447 RepID=A0A497JI54_9ARCH|nr:MAG: hypothetical protein DRO04_00430 [Candidatus Diapherotrites archaeon]